MDHCVARAESLTLWVMGMNHYISLFFRRHLSALFAAVQHHAAANRLEFTEGQVVILIVARDGST